METSHWRVALAIVAAGILIALAIYLRPLPNRYRFEVANGELQRFDTVTGGVMICAQGRCGKVTNDGKVEAQKP